MERKKVFPVRVVKVRRNRKNPAAEARVRVPESCAFVSVCPINSRLYVGQSKKDVQDQISGFIKGTEIEAINLDKGTKESSSYIEVVLAKTIRRKHRKYCKFIFVSDNIETLESLNSLLNKHLLFSYRKYRVDEEGNFPEASIGVRNKTAVCISGGGKRAFLCGGGQLRALHHLGLLSKDIVNYLSASSGGAVATTIYSFYNSEACASDDILFGPTSDASALTLESLNRECSPIGQGARNSIIKSLARNSLLRKAPLKECFKRTIAKAFLADFGLDNDFPLMLKEKRDKILNENPFLDEKGINLTHSDRPFWICQAVLLGPSWSREINPIPMEFTPLYSGLPFKRELQYQRKGYFGSKGLVATVGGEVEDTFAFGGVKLEARGKASAEVENEAGFEHCLGSKSLVATVEGTVEDTFAFGGVKLEARGTVNAEVENAAEFRHSLSQLEKHPSLTLRDICGTVSSGPALTINSMPIVKRLVPEISSFSTNNSGMSASSLQCVDGGLLDNLGILSMLQRKVKRIVVFNNTTEPVPVAGEDPKLTSTNVVPLFGVHPEPSNWGEFRRNQVFHREDFDELAEKLSERRNRGELPVVRQRLEVLENEWWNIAGNWEVEILWFYLSKSETFEALLPKETQDALEKDELGSFPMYSTFKDVYSNSEINLLQAYSEWCVMENKDLLTDFLRG